MRTYTEERTEDFHERAVVMTVMCDCCGEMLDYDTTPDGRSAGRHYDDWSPVGDLNAFPDPDALFHVCWRCTDDLNATAVDSVRWLTSSESHRVTADHAEAIEYATGVEVHPSRIAHY